MLIANRFLLGKNEINSDLDTHGYTEIRDCESTLIWLIIYLQ